MKIRKNFAAALLFCSGAFLTAVWPCPAQGADLDKTGPQNFREAQVGQSAELLRNGAFELWKDDRPLYWSGVSVTRETQMNYQGSGVALRTPLDAGKSAELAYKGIELKPDTSYRLEMWYRLYSLSGGAVQWGIREGERAVVSRSPLGVMYWHTKGAFISTTFRTSAKAIDPAQAELYFRFRGAEDAVVVIDEVSLSTEEEPPTSVIFKEGTKDKVTVTVSVSNSRPNAQQVALSFNMVNYFMEPVSGAAWTAERTLEAGGRISYSYAFDASASRLWRGRLNLRFTDGYAREIVQYYEPARRTCDRSSLRLDLLAGWRTQKAGAAVERPDEAQWQPVSLPNYAERGGDSKWLDEKISLTENRYVWYRLAFDAPELAEGERAILRFKNASLSPAVFLNGKELGGTVGRQPLEVDATEAYKGAGSNQLTVRLDTWRGAVKVTPEGRYLSLPYGLDTGIVDDVVLERRTPVHLAEVTVFPSVREKKLKVRYLLKNDSRRNAWVTVTGEATGEGKEEWKLPRLSRYLRAADSIYVWSEVAAAKPHLWFPHDPFLYRLNSSLLDESGKPFDAVSTRFGFRETWTEGPYFYLNGSKLYMPARLGFPHMDHVGGGIPETRTNCWTMLRLDKDNGITHARSYAMAPEFRTEVADEIGVTLRQSFELDLAYGGMNWMPRMGPEYWSICRDYIETQALALANHPSIVMWDMQNETFLCSTLNRHPELAEEYVSLQRHLRAVLPGALATHDDGYNPRDDADVTLLHYPFNFIRYFPRKSDFPAPVFTKGRRYQTQMGRGSFTWYGDRPLGLGECHGFGGSNPGALTYLFGGEEVYAGVYRSRSQWTGDTAALIQAHNEELKVLLRLYREAEMCLINPWPFSDEAIADAMVENIAYIRQYDRNFFSGERVDRTAVVAHGVPYSENAELEWALLNDGGVRLIEGKAPLGVLKDGQIRYQDISFSAPDMSKPTEFYLELAVKTSKGVIARGRAALKVWPRTHITVPRLLKIALFDPPATTEGFLRNERIPFAQVRSMHSNDLEGANLLIVGRGALTSDAAMGAKEEIERFVAAGNRVIVFAQEENVPGWLPLRMRLRKGVYWRRAHIRAEDHPVMRGFARDDFLFWRGDCSTSRFDYFKPFSGNFTPILDSGSIEGLVNSPLIEIPWGKGSYILCQLGIVEKGATEPAARQLWQNLLDYCDSPPYRTTEGRMVVVAEKGSNLARFVERFAFASDVVGAQAVDAEALKDAAAALVDGAANPTPALCDALLAYALEGGKVWLHGVKPENAAAWSTLVEGLKVESLMVGDSLGDSRTTKRAYDPVIAGLCNSDLYWKGVPQFGWAGEDYGTAYVGSIVSTRVGAAAPAAALSEYGELTKVKLGKGFVLVDNLQWDLAWREISFAAPRIASLIATNLGVRVSGGLDDRPVDPASLTFTPVNITNVFNEELSDVLAKGVNKYADVPFDVYSNGRGAVLLGSSALASKRSPKELPRKVEGIGVMRKADYIYFLQTAWDVYEGGPGWGTGEVYGGYRIHYADGTTEYAPLQGMIHATIPCDNHGDLPGATVGWPSRENAEPQITQTIFANWLDTYVRLEGRWIQREHNNRLYVMCWTNPYPDKEVRNIDFVSSDGFVLPILLAITTASSPKK